MKIRILYKILPYVTIIVILSVVNLFASNKSDDYTNDEKIIFLVDKLCKSISPELIDIDHSINRIAIYNIKIEPPYLKSRIAHLLIGNLQNIFQSFEYTTLVVLPKLNGLKINSTDSTFRILNQVPSTEELWRIARRQRIKAFLEGECNYIIGHSMSLNLRLTKVGSGDVVWSKSFVTYVNEMEPKTISRPKFYDISLGMEAISVVVEDDSSFVSKDFDDYLTYHTIDVGMFQYITDNKRFRYEIRAGLAFLANGIKLNKTAFTEHTFYGDKKENEFGVLPVGFRLNSLLYFTLVPRNDNNWGDWLSMYLSISRHFVKESPDFNCVGVGLRTDFTRNFSISTGFSFVFSPRFDSVALEGTDTKLNIDLKGIQYHLLFIQYVF